MRALVVYCHPRPDSFSAALRDAVIGALNEAGHEVRLIDLYGANFDPVMGPQEHLDYIHEQRNQAYMADQIALIKWCQYLVFVYPTWWYGPPAMLKGWLDRVWVPHVTFAMPTETTPIRPNMLHVEKIAVITTCGATWWISKLIGEPGRRMLLRGIRALCHRRCKTLYMALYKMDTSTHAQRQAYLERVARKVGAL